MGTYLRIISPIEKELIDKEGIIPTNFDSWTVYDSGRVVFLFDFYKTPAQAITNLIELKLEEWDHVYLIKIRLTPSDRNCISKDESNEGWDYSHVHSGKIHISDLLDYTSLKIVPDLALIPTNPNQG